jgi:hypothetical protein
MAARNSKLVLDSGNRDTNAYPTPASYAIPLPEGFTDVRELRLESAWFPFSATQVNEHNCTFGVMLNGVAYAVNIPAGNYTTASLSAALQAALRQQASTGFSVSADPATTVLSIAHDAQPFALAASSAAKVLGFANASYASAAANGAHVITAPYACDLDDYNRYVILSIDLFDDLVSPNNAANRAFGILYKHKMDAGVDPQIVSVCLPPLGKLGRLSVTVQDRYGNAYNSQNRDHVFMFTVVSDAVRRNW